MMPPRQAHTSTPAAARFGPMNPGPSMSETVAVIPCYNHPQTIGFMVDAVRAHQLAVIVVDDGSATVCAEGLDGLARRHGATLTLLRLADNLGKGGGRRAGQRPDAVVYGVPLYDDCGPKARLYGRYATHIWVWINTLSLDIRDSMCGFRVYPLEPVVRLIYQTPLRPPMHFYTQP